MTGGFRTNEATPSGPSATERELFDELDLTSDALKPVVAAVAAGDMTKAEHDLADYFCHRSSPAWKFDAKAAPTNPPVKDPRASLSPTEKC